MRKKDMLDISTPKDVLITLAMIGGAAAAVAVTPAILAPAVLIKVMQDKKKRAKYVKSAHYLKSKGLARFLPEQRKITLTRKGTEKALLHSLKKRAALSQKRKWDKEWRVLIYDIEASERAKRNAIRHMIQRMGMVPLQKSVWVYPFDCEEEIKLLRECFHLDDHRLRLLYVRKLGNDNALKRHFKL